MPFGLLVLLLDWDIQVEVKVVGDLFQLDHRQFAHANDLVKLADGTQELQGVRSQHEELETAHALTLHFGAVGPCTAVAHGCVSPENEDQ